MGLITRMVLLVTLAFLAVTAGMSIGSLDEGSPAALDRLAAARYERTAIAARMASLEGGIAMQPAGKRGRGEANTQNKLAELDTVAEESSEIGALEKMIDEKNGEITTEGTDAAAALQKYKDDKSAKADELKGMAPRIAQNTTSVQDFANEIRPFAKKLSGQATDAIALQDRLQILYAEMDSLDAANASTITELASIKSNSKSIEDAIRASEKEHLRLSELLGIWTKENPEILRDAARAGTPWIDGVISEAGSNPQVGLVKISVGSNDGLKDQQMLSIYRDGKFIARCRVSNLRDNYAIARVVEGTVANDGVMPLAGDSVTGVPFALTR